MVGAVEKAIRESDLGLNPQTEGQVIRLRIPEMNEQRRKEMVKVAHKYAEEARVAVRHVRRDGLDLLKKLEKDGAISEDDGKRHGRSGPEGDRSVRRRGRRRARARRKRKSCRSRSRTLQRKIEPMTRLKRSCRHPRAGPQSGGEGVPAHVAIIMDGNGRWAAERGLAALRGAPARASRRCAAPCARPTSSASATSPSTASRPRTGAGPRRRSPT